MLRDMENEKARVWARKDLRSGHVRTGIRVASTHIYIHTDTVHIKWRN